MKCIAELEDDMYPFSGITHTRQIARAILTNEKGEVCLMHIKCDDIFGHRDYWETPGGGIKEGETPEMAVLREINEETGYEAEILRPIGYVSDYYNLLQRHNMNHYFLLKVMRQGRRHLDEYENGLFEGMRWFSPKEAVAAYEAMVKEPIEHLVRRRELPVLLDAIQGN